jgi:hypothetical protein
MQPRAMKPKAPGQETYAEVTFTHAQINRRASRNQPIILRDRIFKTLELSKSLLKQPRESLLFLLYYLSYLGIASNELWKTFEPYGLGGEGECFAGRE